MKKEIIVINQLTKTFGKKEVLNIDELKIQTGEFFGFVGPNGAGKTTTINLLLNFKYPTSGTAKIFGLDIIKDSKEIKTNLGFVAGEVELYKMKVKDLIEYAKKFHKNINDEYVNYLISVLNLELNDKIQDLSLGNRKKVFIVVALMNKPKLLILDEPTSGLDPIIQEAFFKLLKELQAEGSTIFMSSHILSDIEQYCDRVAFIKEGKIIEVISIKDIKKQMGYSAIGKTMDNDSINFTHEKDINKLLSKVSKLKIKEIRISEETVSDKFKNLFKEEN